MHAVFLSDNLKGKDYLKDLRLDGGIMLKWILNKCIGKRCTGFICLSTGSISGVF